MCFYLYEGKLTGIEIDSLSQLLKDEKRSQNNNDNQILKLPGAFKQT